MDRKRIRRIYLCFQTIRSWSFLLCFYLAAIGFHDRSDCSGFGHCLVIIHCPSSDGFATKSFIAAFVFWDDQLSSPFGSICEHHADGARDVKRQILISIPRRVMHSIIRAIPTHFLLYCYSPRRDYPADSNCRSRHLFYGFIVQQSCERVLTLICVRVTNID